MLETAMTYAEWRFIQKVFTSRPKSRYAIPTCIIKPLYVTNVLYLFCLCVCIQEFWCCWSINVCKSWWCHAYMSGNLVPVPMLITLLVNYRKHSEQLSLLKCRFGKQAENILFHMAPSLIVVMVCISWRRVVSQDCLPKPNINLLKLSRLWLSGKCQLTLWMSVY